MLDSVWDTLRVIAGLRSRLSMADDGAAAGRAADGGKPVAVVCAVELGGGGSCRGCEVFLIGLVDDSANSRAASKVPQGIAE